MPAIDVQLEILKKNINSIIANSTRLKSKTLTSVVAPIDISQYILTKRQIAKKIILITAGVVSNTGAAVQNIAGATQSAISSSAFLGADIPPEVPEALSNYDVQFGLNAATMIGQKITPEAAHFIVYGKFMRDESGNLIDNEVLYPDCVLQELAMPEIHPTMANIQVMITQLTRVLTMLPIRANELASDIMQSTMAIAANITAIASAAAILPPGAGVPVAFSAFQSLLANLMNLVSKVSNVAIDIEYLNYLPLLVDGAKMDAILNTINGVLTIINTTLATVDTITSFISSSSAAPTPPGVAGTPGEPITVEAKAEPDTVDEFYAGNIKLSATANKGSWEYTYRWTGPDGFLSSEKDLILIGAPYQSTEYTVTVTDKNDSANSATTNVWVNVAI